MTSSSPSGSTLFRDAPTPLRLLIAAGWLAALALAIRFLWTGDWLQVSAYLAIWVSLTLNIGLLHRRPSLPTWAKAGMALLSALVLVLCLAVVLRGFRF